MDGKLKDFPWIAKYSTFTHKLYLSLAQMSRMSQLHSVLTPICLSPRHTFVFTPGNAACNHPWTTDITIWHKTTIVCHHLMLHKPLLTLIQTTPEQIIPLKPRRFGESGLWSHRPWVCNVAYVHCLLANLTYFALWYNEYILHIYICPCISSALLG